MNQRRKSKSKSNLEKAGGYAYGAAKGLAKAEIAGLKAVGGFLMPQRKAAKTGLKRMPKPAKRKPFGGTETRPNEREGKRIAPRQRMPKEIEKNPPRKTRPRTYQPLPNPRRPYKPKSPRDLSNRRRRNASGGGSGSSYGS